MGVKIMATIGVISAAAVYGISKLRDMSNQTTQALNATSAASTQAGGSSRACSDCSTRRGF